MAIVRSAEAPREVTEEQINAQLPSLARVLTAGYRHQVDTLIYIAYCTRILNMNTLCGDGEKVGTDPTSQRIIFEGVML